ncbi:hypothetical protein MSC49_33250 [Methylosinus sp. C49]|nr:hypothetical protein MSC49_33250 [Methylosinus sp. C49]
MDAEPPEGDAEKIGVSGAILFPDRIGVIAGVMQNDHRGRYGAQPLDCDEVGVFLDDGSHFIPGLCLVLRRMLRRSEAEANFRPGLGSFVPRER